MKNFKPGDAFFTTSEHTAAWPDYPYRSAFGGIGEVSKVYPEGNLPVITGKGRIMLVLCTKISSEKEQWLCVYDGEKVHWILNALRSNFMQLDHYKSPTSA